MQAAARSAGITAARRLDHVRKTQNRRTWSSFCFYAHFTEKPVPTFSNAL
jgi:hypothetical protein